MNVGFAVTSRIGGTEFRLYQPPATKSPREPWLSLINFARTDRSAAVLMGRLYYRDEQLKRLDSPPAELAPDIDRNDAALALAVYHRAGRKGLEALEGDFSLVVRDEREKTILALRDPNGGYPLFWHQNESTVALSTGVSPLVQLLPQRKIDQDYVADFLMLPGSNGEELVSKHSVYEGISRLGPGNILTIRHAGEKVEIQQQVYWNWSEHFTSPKGKTLEEISHEYADTLRAAVRERMRGSTAAHFSGGMDSTALALLARDESARVGGGPVHALALVYKRLDVLKRETEYLEMALQGQSGFEVHRVPADDILDFAMLIDPPPHDEPWTWLTRGGMNNVLLDAAAAAGANTVLTGIGADELLGSVPFRLTDLMRRGRIFSAWREAKRWARGRTSSPWNIFHPHGVVPLLPFALRAGVRPWARSLLGRRSVRYKDQTASGVPPWILPGFASKYRLPRRAVKLMGQWYGNAKGLSASQENGLAAIHGRSGDMSRWHSAAPRGMHVAHPFLDARVLSLGLGIPDAIRNVPGVQKPVLAEAMKGILPQDILVRRRKGHFNEVYNLGLTRYLADLEKIAIDRPMNGLDIFDRKILADCLNEAAIIGGGNMVAEDRLNLSLSLIQWVSHADQWNAGLPAPSEVITIVPQ